MKEKFQERLFAVALFFIMVGMIICLLSCRPDPRYTRYVRVHQYRERLVNDSTLYWYVIYLKPDEDGKSIENIYFTSSTEPLKNLNGTKFYKTDAIPFVKELVTEMDELTVDLNQVPDVVTDQIEDGDIGKDSFRR
jgi:hypothetical protein